MIYVVYTLALALGLILLSPYFVYQALKHKKYLSTLGQRLGWIDPIQPGRRPTLWIHAVSVGEALAAQPLVRRLRERFPAHHLFFSTTTITGQEIAHRRLSGVAQVIYFPLDFPFSVRRYLDAVAPSLVLIVETEIWPNFLRACHRDNIPVILINGRISDRSFQGYRIFRRLMARVLDHFRLLLMQSQQDADRLLELGAQPDRVIVTGSLKYDLEVPDLGRQIEELDHLIGLTRGRLFVAGSTARGEEELILKAFTALIGDPRFQDVRLLLAPRHPERFDEVEALISRTGLSFVRRSRAPTAQDRRSCRVILLDTLGELAAVYAVADVVFVGGSLVPVGGHNVLEPALFGKPILVGAYTSNFQAIVDEFAEQEAVIQLLPTTDRSPQEQLADALRSLFGDPARQKTLGARARRLLERNRGATERTLQIIAQSLAATGDQPPVLSAPGQKLKAER